MNKKKMTDEAAAGTPSAKTARKPSGRKGKVSAKAKARTKGSTGTGFDFIGKVESIVVKTGAGGESFEFGLRGRHGLRQTLALGTSDSFALSIMAPIVTAAHATESKIAVRVAQGQGGVPLVIEVASRPKLGKDS